MACKIHPIALNKRYELKGTDSEYRDIAADILDLECLPLKWFSRIPPSLRPLHVYYDLVAVALPPAV
ncbi:MAG: hypothetical protein M3Q52_02505 [Pseudomonadota bacterium]|nr:hypothetical protein [Pseudomonadota bacterium]